MSARTHTEYLIEVRIEANTRADAEAVHDAIGALIERTPEPDILHASTAMEVAEVPMLRIAP